jgi:hypothetical protein
MFRRARPFFAVLAIVVSVAAVAASGDDNKAEKVNGDGKTSGSASTTYKVGDEVKLGDWTVKVYGVANPQQPVNQFSQPKPGTKWIGVDAEVKNLSKDPATVSSLACFKVHDSANHDYDEEITSGVTPQAPDGQIEPGGAKRGVLVYEVPQDATGLQLRFNCDLFDSGQAIIELG